VCGSTRASRVTQSSFGRWAEIQAEREAVAAAQVRQEEAVRREEQAAREKKSAFCQGDLKLQQKVVRDITEVRRIFNAFDTDQSGSIEPAEFLPLLAKLLKQPPNTIDTAEVWRNWDMVDVDGSGSITFDEFTEWYCPTFGVDCLADLSDFINQDIVSAEEKLIREVAKNLGMDNVTIEKVYREFSKLDDDKSGQLEYEEFEQLMVKSLAPGPNSPGLPKKVLERFWMDIDADGSGGVSFPEFAEWYLKFFHSAKTPMEQYYHMLGSPWWC